MTKPALSQTDLSRIKAVVEEAESRTSGEIRVRIIHKCDQNLAGNVRAQALREFERLGLSQTRDKTGVLVLLVLDEGTYYILADKGIHDQLSDNFLNTQAQMARRYFEKGWYADGLSAVVQALGIKLARFFPRKPDDRNELRDDVSVEP